MSNCACVKIFPSAWGILGDGRSSRRTSMPVYRERERERERESPEDDALCVVSVHLLAALCLRAESFAGLLKGKGQGAAGLRLYGVGYRDR